MNNMKTFIRNESITEKLQDKIRQYESEIEKLKGEAAIKSFQIMGLNRELEIARMVGNNNGIVGNYNKN